MTLALGVLLAEVAPFEVALPIVRACRDEVVLFLMHEGVRLADDARLDALLGEGVDVVLCAQDAEARGVGERDGGPRFGSQYDHAAMVRDAARVLTLTGAAVDDHVFGAQAARRVVVEVAAPLASPRAAQALRAAVAYRALGLDARVVSREAPCVGEALAALTPAAQRAYQTLAGADAIAASADAAGALVVHW